MKLLPLTNNLFAKVDDVDFKRLIKYKWNCSLCKDGFYRISTTQHKKTIILSRLIMKSPKGKVVDHINHDNLDNRKINLRVCTNSENLYNLKLRKSSKYGYKGISLRKNKWIVQLKKNNKYFYCGLFDDKIEAAKAYDKKAKELFGTFANLNFKLSRS